MSKVQAGIFPFVIVNVHGNILKQVEGLAVSGFKVLYIGGEDVVGFPGRNALGEFTVMVGVDFPLGLLVLSAAYFYGHTVNRVIVGTPDSSGDQGVGLFIGPGPLSSKKVIPKAEARQQKQYCQEPGGG